MTRQPSSWPISFSLFGLGRKAGALPTSDREREEKKAVARELLPAPHHHHPHHEKDEPHHPNCSAIGCAIVRFSQI